MQKNTEKMKKGKSSWAHGKRIFCLLLTLVLTLTGLPMGGVETAKATTYSTFSLGSNTYGNYDENSATLTVWSILSEDPADAFYALASDRAQDWDRVCASVKKIIFKSGNGIVFRFSSMPNLETIQFNDVRPLDPATAFKNVPKLRQVILPANATEDYIASISQVLAANAGAPEGTFTSEEAFVKQIALTVVSGKFDGGSYYETDKVCKQTYKSSDLGTEGKTIEITPVRYDKMEFDSWIVTAVDSNGTTLPAPITGVNITGPNDAGVVQLTLTKAAPTNIRVLAKYREIVCPDPKKLLDTMKQAVKGYRAEKEKELYEAPTAQEVEDDLKELFDGMLNMGDAIKSYELTDFTEGEREASTTTEQGHVTYSFKLTVTNQEDSQASVPDCSLTLNLLKKENRTYTVTVDGGTIVGEQPGIDKKDYTLTEIETKDGSLNITLVSADRTDKNLYYDGWTIEPNDMESKLAPDVTEEQNMATGGAILTIEENSPSQIVVSAKYKTGESINISFDDLFAYMWQQIPVYKAENERYIFDLASVPTASVVQNALNEKLQKEVAKSDVLKEDADACVYTVTQQAVQDSTIEETGSAQYEISLKLTKKDDTEEERTYQGGLTLTIPQKQPPASGGDEDPGETKPSRPIGGGGAPAPSEPAKPADPEGTTDPTKPTDTESTTDPTKPTDTETTEDPANPTDPTTPTQPISVSTKTNTAKVKVEDLQEAADNQQGMTVKYKNATVKFDATAVASIAKQAKNIGGSTISLVCKPGAASSLNSAQKKALKNKTVIECYSIYLKCGSKKITTFGKGKVTVKVPVTLTAAQKSKNVKLYYVDDKGKLTKVTITYKSGYLTFKTTHFSIYAAIYPKTAQTTDTATDKDTDKDTTQKPEKELGTENETLAYGSVTDADIVGLPSVEKGETVNFRTLQLRLTRSDDTSVRLAWNQVKGADGYELYGARCNTDTKRYEIVRIETLGSPMFTAWICSNLKKNTYYKFVVRAYKLDGDEKIYIARSRSAHVATGGNGYGFITDVTVNRSKVKLAVGKTFTIKASVDTGSQKIRPHYSVRYESTKPSVATVNSRGKITAKKKGTCYIYVYTQNGLYTKVKVTVR